MIVLAIKGDNVVVGRLFNRTLLPQAKDIIVDPFERPWHAQGKASASGGFFTLNEELQHSTTSIKCVSTKHSQINDLSRKNKNIPLQLQQRHPPHSHKDPPQTNGEDDRERIGDDDDDDARLVVVVVVVVPQAIKDETNLPLCSNEEEPSPPPLLVHRGKIKSRHETQLLRTVPSAIANPSKHRRSRKRNRVAFVGNPTLLVKPNQIDTVFRCDFMDIVEVLYIPPISEYSREVLNTLWYTRDETEHMKHDFFYRKRISSEGQQRSPTAPPTSVSSTLTTAGRSHNLRCRRQQRTVATVLQEQEKQRRMCHKIHGRLVDSSGSRRSSGILDPERLRDAYVTEGKTRLFQEEASLRARAYNLVQCDPSVVRDKHEGDDRDINTTSTSTITKDKGESSNIQAHEDPTIREWSSIQEDSFSGFLLDLSTTFNDCICCVFSALLTPFLEQRNGPIFLEIGEEMLVAS
jgi:hypothetical protein